MGGGRDSGNGVGEDVKDFYMPLCHFLLRHVIHTVGPRFNLRYKTAAESALYNCYRSVMQIVRQVPLPC